MPTPISTDFGAILNAVKEKIVLDGYLAQTAVYLGLNAEFIDPPPADQFAVLVPGEQVVDQGVVTGGGNTTFVFDGILNIWLWVRLATDEVSRSDLWLTDPNLGALATNNKLIKSLQLSMITDPDGNALVYSPMKLVSINQGVRVNSGTKLIPPGWGNMVTKWRMKWWMNMD